VYDHGGNVRRVAFSPDGDRLAAAGLGDAARVWDRDGARTDLPGHGAAALSVAFLPDGRPVTTAVEGTLRAWDGDEPTTLATLEDPGQAPVAANGDRIAVGVAGGVRAFDHEGTPVGAVTVPVKGVYAVAFAPAGGFLAGGSDGRLRLWEAV
jgi:WD40 repeat protein